MAQVVDRPLLWQATRRAALFGAASAAYIWAKWLWRDQIRHELAWTLAAVGANAIVCWSLWRFLALKAYEQVVTWRWLSSRWFDPRLIAATACILEAASLFTATP